MQNGSRSIILARRIRDAGGRPLRGDALVVIDGRISACTSRRAALAHRERGIKLHDLRDSTITPGLTDAHTHLLYWALQRALTIDLAGVSTRAAALARVRDLASRRRVGGWVIGRGYDSNRWPDGPPTAAALDTAVPDRPAILYSRDWHSAWLNTRGLRAAGLAPTAPDPPRGRYVRDARGRLTGVIQEDAIQALPDPLRELARRTDAEAVRVIDAALAAAYRVAWSLGIVAVHSMDDGASLFHLQRQRAAGRLGLRVVHAIPLDRLEDAIRLGLCSGLGDEWLRIGAVKIFADGSLGSQTALMFDPYPGRGTDCGVAVVAGDELRRHVERAAGRGLAAWIHAIGDRAAHEAIAAIAAARRLEASPLPHRIEHAQCLRSDDVRRMARLRIAASVQPCHLIGDYAVADRHWPRARHNAFVLRRMIDAGVTLALGSDVPVESIDPRRSLYAAVCRMDECGRPPGGWFPQQGISVREALFGFTRGAAASAGLPLPAGTLRYGAPADLTVWRDDPLEVEPHELLSVRIAGCFVAGVPRMVDARAGG